MYIVKNTWITLTCFHTQLIRIFLTSNSQFIAFCFFDELRIKPVLNEDQPINNISIYWYVLFFSDIFSDQNI